MHSQVNDRPESSATVCSISRTAAFPKADVQNARVGSEPNVRFWPKADVR